MQIVCSGNAGAAAQLYEVSVLGVGIRPLITLGASTPSAARTLLLPDESGTLLSSSSTISVSTPLSTSASLRVGAETFLSTAIVELAQGAAEPLTLPASSSVVHVKPAAAAVSSGAMRFVLPTGKAGQALWLRNDRSGELYTEDTAPSRTTVGGGGTALFVYIAPSGWSCFSKS